MGYYIRKLNNIRKIPNWKLQFVSYRKSDQNEDSKAKKPQRTWSIKTDRYQKLGFYHLMTLDEAKARARQLNAKSHHKHQEQRIKKIQDDGRVLAKKFDSVLPIEFVDFFEKRFITGDIVNSLDSRERKARLKYRYTHWNAAQKMIAFVGREPTDWFFFAHEFYYYIFQNQFSLGYMRGIYRMANLWGHYMTRVCSQPFSPLRLPRGYERGRILNAFYEKERPRRRPSKMITPQKLEAIKDDINIQNFNWLYLSVWLGLRPKEVDSLNDPSMFRVEILPTNTKVLWVFQTKIVSLPPEERWKPIPLLFDEQRFALKIIEGGCFKRPLSKTVPKHLGTDHGLYGGRKGFTDLMLSKGQSLHNISIWLGHSSINRTWVSYKDKRTYHL